MDATGRYATARRVTSPASRVDGCRLRRGLLAVAARRLTAGLTGGSHRHPLDSC